MSKYGWFILSVEQKVNITFWGECLPEVVEGGGVCVVVVEGLGVEGLGVVVETGGRLDLVKVALNPLEVKLLSVLKRSTIVLPLVSTGFGIVPPQNLPLMDYMCIQIVEKRMIITEACAITEHIPTFQVR